MGTRTVSTELGSLKDPHQTTPDPSVKTPERRVSESRQRDAYAKVAQNLSTGSDDSVNIALTELAAINTPDAKAIANILRNKPIRSKVTSSDKKREFYQALETAMRLLSEAWKKA